MSRMNMLKDMIIRLRTDGQVEAILENFQQHFKDVSIVDLLLIELKLINGDDGITVEDIRLFNEVSAPLMDHTVTSEASFAMDHPSHPIQVFKKENAALQDVLHQIDHQLQSLEKEKNTDMLEHLKDNIVRLGEFHHHYHRKEKLFFPIMERYGYHHDATRMVWRVDDRIRALYQAVKRQVLELQDVNLVHLSKTFAAFAREFTIMMFQEEVMILPVLQALFSEKDWMDIAEESNAFGYVLIEVKEEWPPASKENEADQMVNNEDSAGNIRFGGGYLTIEEANQILNHLPLEITFVDKNSVFKYFNETTEASEMMLVRTPTSIGRNVANCHPPKSLKKVMTLIRDLKTKKRTSESMWYKKNDQYIYLTYKALFNEKDEFLGILEYVQDIQPFFDLPSEVKIGLSKLDE